MTTLSFLVIAVFATSVSGMTVVKREVPLHGDYGGLNSVGDFHHFSDFKLPPPPAYSTISFLQSHHSKPVAYSGFTNHGRGHYDPGFAVEYRSEGLIAPRHQHHSGFY